MKQFEKWIPVPKKIQIVVTVVYHGWLSVFGVHLYITIPVVFLEKCH